MDKVQNVDSAKNRADENLRKKNKEKERELQQSRTDVIKYQKERMIRSKELAETRNSLLRRTKEVRELKGVWGFGHDLLAKVISYYHLSNQLHRYERLLGIWIF